MSAKKTVKKSAGKKKPAAKAAAVKGYKGHRAGSAKEKIHMLYDKHGPEKARPMAEKLLAASTVMTSFSQFKKVAGRKAGSTGGSNPPVEKSVKKARICSGLFLFSIDRITRRFFPSAPAWLRQSSQGLSSEVQ
jgi:hypothetical protein